MCLGRRVGSPEPFGDVVMPGLPAVIQPRPVATEEVIPLLSAEAGSEEGPGHRAAVGLQPQLQCPPVRAGGAEQSLGHV